MKCKACGAENPDYHEVCQSCGGYVESCSADSEKWELKRSCFFYGFVPTFMILAAFGLFIFINVAPLSKTEAAIYAQLTFGLLVVAIVAGLVSFEHLIRLLGAPSGRIYALAIIVISVSLLVLCFYTFGRRFRGTAYRMTCGTNLSGIGKAMLIYANDYEDEFPKAGLGENLWTDSLGGHGNSHAWCGDSREKAYGTDGVGKTTVSASLYLLVKYAEVTPKSFICKEDKLANEFRLKDWKEYVLSDVELWDVWDFGFYASKKKNPARHVSYAYHFPFDDMALTVSHEPGMAVAADRSAWIDATKDPDYLWSEFRPDLDSDLGTVVDAKKGNSKSHKGEGQNILYLDSHVAFEKRAFVGMDKDNIYTVQAGDGADTLTKGMRPMVYDAERSRPLNRHDSVLVQEHILGR